MASQTIKFMVEEDWTKGGIPIPNVTSMILAKVIEYCQKHANVDAMSSDDVSKPAIEELIAWDDEFIRVNQDILFNLVLVADFLYIQGLLDLTCQAVANKMKGKSTEEIRMIFNIENDIAL